MRFLYILDADKRPIAVSDILEWGEWMAGHEHEHTLAYDRIGDAGVSTVYLGVAMGLPSMFPDRPPLLWETMIFGGRLDRYQARYTSHDEAMAGHAAAVALVRGDAPQ